ncbi:PKD domain-containing protein [Kriegella sp. EG-1]|nr:PKD domain-containing protein [Flavobacteriaceae bacterium EG-1]
MTFHPTRLNIKFLCFILFSFILVLSCGKDSDILSDSILNEASQSIEDRNSRESESEDNIIEDTETEDISEIEEEEPQLYLESRTTTFFPIQDAYIHDGEGVNHEVIRLQTNSRKSYLLFDLSPIDSIGGAIVNVEFQFTIYKDDGDGEINIHKGSTLKWHEDDLNEDTAPEANIVLGSIDKTYELEKTESVELLASEILPENTTIILEQANGDDVAIASKEHATEEAPKLIITYETAIDAESIEEYILEENIVSEEEEEEEEEEEITLNVEASSDITKGEAPLEVTFNAEASSENAEIVSYQWDFKDGSSSDSKSPTHIFDEKGIFKVEVKATDENELSNSNTITIVVGEHENEAPVAIASANKTEGTIPLKITFNGEKSSDDIEIKSYLWDFKDGSEKDNTENPSHTFTKAGTYKVELIVTDDEGLTNTKTVTIRAEEPENEGPTAKLTADTTSGEVPLKVKFSAKNSSDDNEIKTYLWDFKDGKSSSISPTHTFDEAGTYEVELTVTDDEGLSDTATISIEVKEPANEKPNADATANTTKGEAPLKVEFSANKSTDDKEITQYIWDFDGNGSSTDDNPIQTFSQTGTYKVKLTVKDAEGLTDSDYITITVEEEELVTPTSNADVRYWQGQFDSQWSKDRSEAYSMSNSRGRNQEYYYLGLYIDGLSSMWQATGDNGYLDTALELINNTVDDAKSVGGGYLGWPASDGNKYNLWDSYYWRHVATLLRVISQTSSIKNSSKYKNQYNKLLEFSEKNIWDRYESSGINQFYRSRTHMASHWARIGMELYVITKKNKYKEVFENISYGTMYGEPSNLRDQIYDNPKNSSAYAWDQTWGVRKGSNIQDTSHAGVIISFMVLAKENGMYWKQSDLNALIKTVNVIWVGAEKITENIDATGGYASKGRLHEWFYLARYNQSLQNRIKNDYQSNPHLNYFGSQVLGIAALNAKILSDGKAVYPR